MPKDFFLEFKYIIVERFIQGAYRVDNRPRLLCFWVAGEGAKKMETLTDDQVTALTINTDFYVFLQWTMLLMFYNSKL